MTEHIQQAADHRKGLLITAIGGMALTVDIPLIKLSEGETWSVVAARGGMTFFAALVMWAGLRLLTSNRTPIIPGRTGLLVTALYGIAAVSFILAVFHTTTANLVFILAFNPMFAALMGWLLIGERPKPQTFLAMGTMVVGVGLIVSDGLQTGNMVGNGLALFTSLLLSLIITISRKARTGMGFAPLIAAILPCLVGLYMVGGPSNIVVPEMHWLALNGLIIIPVAFWCLATGPKYISGPEVAMFYLLETILAPVWMWLIFAEAPTRLGLIGGAIIVIALVGHSLWQLSAQRRAARALAPRHPL